MSRADSQRMAARIRVVDEHLRRENEHDLDGILATFGDAPLYEDQSWAERYDGPAGVRRFYGSLIGALPDLRIEVQNRHATLDSIVLEVTISGTHLGAWRGLPATGKPVELPLCAIYTFTEDDRLAGERIYYDRATLFRQLGLYRELDTAGGRLAALVGHPVTLACAYARRLWRLPARGGERSG